MSKSYSATLITLGVFRTPMAGSGSFSNINIDGRLSIDSAIEVARETFKKEADHLKQEYIGFAIEKTERFVNYKNPLIVDSTLKVNEIAYLL